MACAFWTCHIVEKKGYKGTWWFVLGFFTLILAVIGAWCLPKKDTEAQDLGYGGK